MKYKTSLYLSLLFLGIALIIPFASLDGLLSMALPLFIPVIVLPLLLSAFFAVMALVRKRTIAAISILLVTGFVSILLIALLFMLLGL